MADDEQNAGPAKPVSVLFVCLGNICRSTMAEAVFQNLTAYRKAKQHPLIDQIDSCGTGAYHVGDGPHSRTMDVLKDNGITGYRHKARQVRVPEDFLEYDYILAMDENNLADLRNQAMRSAAGDKTAEKQALSRIYLYGSFGGKSATEEVEDPYYGGRQGFVVAYDQVTRLGKGLIRHIEEKAAASA